MITSQWQQCLLAPDEMCAVAGLLRRRTLEVAVSAQAGFPGGAATVNLDVGWIHGSEAAKYNTDPVIELQVLGISIRKMNCSKSFGLDTGISNVRPW